MSNKHKNCDAGRGGLSVSVRNDDGERAIKKFKKMIMTDGILKEVKARQAFEKSSDKKRRLRAEAKRRQQKEMSLRLKHEGY